MTRSERLLRLLHLMRRYRRPVSGAVLAQELGVSLRTLYRDIASLQAQGADIEGEPGVGYVLRPGFMLPPLMFTQDELEALMLGFRWVAKFADPQLTRAADDAQAKLSAVLPASLRHELETNTLLVGPRIPRDDDDSDLQTVRMAIRTEHKLRIRYCDEQGRISERVIWPFALGYFQDSRIVAAWCEQRGDFRHFRPERIESMVVLDERYPQHRLQLLKTWRGQQKDVRYLPDSRPPDGCAG